MEAANQGDVVYDVGNIAPNVRWTMSGNAAEAQELLQLLGDRPEQLHGLLEQLEPLDDLENHL